MSRLEIVRSLSVVRAYLDGEVIGYAHERSARCWSVTSRGCGAVLVPGRLAAALTLSNLGAEYMALDGNTGGAGAGPGGGSDNGAGTSPGGGSGTRPKGP